MADAETQNWTWWLEYATLSPPNGHLGNHI